MADKPIYEILLDDENFDGLQYLSLVHNPAIEINFVKLSKQVKLATNLEKRIITGPALIPNQLIDRGEYYWQFSADTIVKINEHFFKNFKNQSINIEHEFPVNNNTIIESWIIDDPEYDKSKKLGFNLPKGTWMISTKIDNDEVWESIKNKELRGYSIEGFLSSKLIQAMSKKEFDQDTLDYLEELIETSTYTEKELENILKEMNNLEINMAASDIYEWVSSPGENCPICAARNGQQEKLSDWVNIGIPGLKSGSIYKGLRTNFSPGPYSTYCEDKCKCKLIKK